MSFRRRARAPPPSRQRLASSTRDPDEPGRPFRRSRRGRRRVHARRRGPAPTSCGSSLAKLAAVAEVFAASSGPEELRSTRPCSSPTPRSSTTARSSASPRTGRGRGDDRAPRGAHPRGVDALRARRAVAATARVLHAETVVTRVTFRALTAAQVARVRRERRGDRQGRRVRGAGARRRRSSRASKGRTRTSSGCPRARWSSRSRGSGSLRDADAATRSSSRSSRSLREARRRRVGGGVDPADGGRRRTTTARDAPRRGARLHVALARRRRHVRGALPGRLSGADRARPTRSSARKPVVAMLVNAVIGAAGAWAVHDSCCARVAAGSRSRPGSPSRCTRRSCRTRRRS